MKELGLTNVTRQLESWQRTESPLKKKKGVTSQGYGFKILWLWQPVTLDVESSKKKFQQQNKNTVNQADIFIKRAFKWLLWFANTLTALQTFLQIQHLSICETDPKE